MPDISCERNALPDLVDNRMLHIAILALANFKHCCSGEPGSGHDDQCAIGIANHWLEYHAGILSQPPVVASAEPISAARFGVVLTLPQWLKEFAEERNGVRAHEDAVNLLRCKLWLEKALAAGVGEGPLNLWGGAPHPPPPTPVLVHWQPVDGLNGPRCLNITSPEGMTSVFMMTRARAKLTCPDCVALVDPSRGAKKETSPTVPMVEFLGLRQLVLDMFHAQVGDNGETVGALLSEAGYRGMVDHALRIQDRAASTTKCDGFLQHDLEPCPYHKAACGISLCPTCRTWFRAPGSQPIGAGINGHPPIVGDRKEPRDG